jgi:hypothetical protein
VPSGPKVFDKAFARQFGIVCEGVRVGFGGLISAHAHRFDDDLLTFVDRQYHFNLGVCVASPGATMSEIVALVVIGKALNGGLAVIAVVALVLLEACGSERDAVPISLVL